MSRQRDERSAVQTMPPALLFAMLPDADYADDNDGYLMINAMRMRRRCAALVRAGK